MMAEVEVEAFHSKALVCGGILCGVGWFGGMDSRCYFCMGLLHSSDVHMICCMCVDAAPSMHAPPTTHHRQVPCCKQYAQKTLLCTTPSLAYVVIRQVYVL